MMKKFLMFPFLLIASLLFVSCVSEEDLESALAGSACETLDSFKCDGDILLKCEEYTWEKFKQCSGNKKCNESKGICEETEENSSGNDADTDDQGNNPGGNQGDNGDSGNSPAPNPGDDNTDTGSNPNPGDDNGDTGSNPGPNPNPGDDNGDTGYQPPDNGDSGDTGYNPPDSGCTKITLGSFTMSDETDPDYDFYEYTASYSPSSNSSDVFVLQLIGNNNSGNYNLAGKNYSDDSGAFVLVFENSGTIYFQQSGTIRFNSFNSTSGALSAQLNSVKLVEVTIANDGSYTSTPVANGKCLEIQDTTINVGGGNGGNDDPATGCTGLSIDWSSFTYYEDDNIEGYFAYVEFGNTSMSDDFQMQFFQNSNGNISTGTYDLGSGKNANYSTCTECVLAYQDYNESTDEYTKLFFQKSGTLKLTKATTNGAALTGTISAKLIEVTINPSNDYTSTPVSGGACLEIETGSFNYSGN